MATITVSNLSNTATVTELKPTTTLEDIKPSTLNIQNIAYGALATVLALSITATAVDIKPTTSNIQSINYSKIVTATTILPFRLTITNIGIEGYNPNNPPGIGVQVIGFSNYIL